MEPNTNTAGPPGGEARVAPSDMGAGDEAIGQYVTFYVEKEFFAFPLAAVLEIIRVPDTVRVPLAPPSLVGLANLRGSVLPILDLRKILQFPEADHDDATRVVVTDVGTPVGLVVDRVAQVLNVERDKIESSDAVQATIKADLLTGVVKEIGGRSLVQLLDVQRCISLEFAAVVERAKAERAESTGATGEPTARSGDEERDEESLQIVTFVVDDQEYAFSIADVQEIVRVPSDISRVPRAEANVLGLMNLRNRLLPLVGMRRIFGLPEVELTGNERILVVTLRDDQGRQESVGIVVDEVKEVLRVEASVCEVMPRLLKRNGLENQVQCVCRLDGGKRLVSVLSSQALFEHEAVVSAVEAGNAEAGSGTMSTDEQESTNEQEGDEENRLVVFHLAKQEFGVMVEMVQEIIRVPEEMSRVPKTAEHIDGMVNLRGSVLPVLDLRARFGIPRAERNDRQRILVLNQDGVCTGFIVDSVSEVLRLPRGVLERAPKLSDEQTRIMGRVANLREAKRMIQVLDARELIGDAQAA